MTSKHWWDPKVLQEREELEASESLDRLSTAGDFGSYKHMLKDGDIERSRIKLHNETEPAYRIKSVKDILGGYDPSRILDVGCGLGFTTKELKNFFPNAEVLGLDISRDAIEFARVNFSDCKFERKVIDPDVDNIGGRFDLVCAFEFYPFTRTNDVDQHRRFLSHLISALSPNGKLVVFQRWDNPASLAVSYDRLIPQFPKMSFRRFSMPIRTLGILIPSRRLALLLSVALRPILRMATGRKIGSTACILIERV